MQQQQESSAPQNGQENKSGEQNQKTNEKSPAEKSRLANLVALLDEKPIETDEDTDEEEEDKDEDKNKDGKPDPMKKDATKDGEKSDKGKGGSKTDIKTFAELSKATGVDKADLYKVKVTLRDQVTQVSIGEMKDAYQNSQDLDFREIEFGERKAKDEQEMSRARQELEVLVSLVPKETLKPEQIAAAAKVVQGQLDRAKADLVRRVPEWEDVELRKSEAAEIDKYLSDYGIKIASIRDPAVIHYIRNAWKQDVRIQKALEKIRKTENNTPQPSGKSENRSRQTKGRNVSTRGRHIARHFMGQSEE